MYFFIFASCEPLNKWQLNQLTYHDLIYLTALPALFREPATVVDNSAASISVSWDAWSDMTDYGTGPVDGFVFYYGKGAITDSRRTNHMIEIVSNLVRGPEYVFAVTVVGVGGAEGVYSPMAIARVECNGNKIC